MDPIVAIVGRPNVGKSTLFNRLIGKRHAIIADEAGTTRDRIFQPCELAKLRCLLVDTGGIESNKADSDIEDNIQAQAQIGIEGADLILFIIDGRTELLRDDFAAAEILRKSQKKVLLVINKCDSPEMDPGIIATTYKLGFGESIQISAIHKLGIDDLRHAIEKELRKQGFRKKKTSSKDASQIDICLLGKPNVGKSSLFNAMIGEEKVIVSELAGTTRDAIDTEIEYEKQKFNLIDTAGLRRRGKIEVGVEKFSSLRSLAAVDRADVVCLMLDGKEKISKQDIHITQYILEKKKGLILVINKIDLFEKGEEEREKIIHKLKYKYSFVPWAPLIFVSAKNKKNIHMIFEIAKDIHEQRQKRIPTAELNSFLEQIIARHHVTQIGRRAPKILYASQVGEAPPEFALVVNSPDNFHFSYLRYLENRLREHYGFTGTPISIKLKQRSNRNKYKQND